MLLGFRAELRRWLMFSGFRLVSGLVGEGFGGWWGTNYPGWGLVDQLVLCG